MQPEAVGHQRLVPVCCTIGGATTLLSAYTWSGDGSRPELNHAPTTEPFVCRCRANFVPFHDQYEIRDCALLSAVNPQAVAAFTIAPGYAGFRPTPSASTATVSAEPKRSHAVNWPGRVLSMFVM